MKEGVPIFDPLGLFDEFKREFRIKDSYKKEFSNAIDLGWYLIARHKEIGNKTLVNRRIAWCVRTILIAEAATQGTFIFSTRDLVDFANNDRVLELISLKDGQSLSAKRVSEFKQLLNSKCPCPDFLSIINNEDFVREHFFLTKNTVGLKTLSAFKYEDDGFHSYF